MLFSNIWNIRKFFIMVGCHIMVLGPFLVNFDICQFLETPGLFE